MDSPIFVPPFRSEDELNLERRKAAQGMVLQTLLCCGLCSPVGFDYIDLLALSWWVALGG